MRVVEVAGVPLLDPFARLEGARRSLVVGVDRDLAEGVTEGAVAEGVVEVLVGVEDRRHRPHPERADVVDDRARGAARRLGVDDQQTVGATDQAHVQVEPLLPGHPHPVGHLSESRHVRQPSKVGTPWWGVPAGPGGPVRESRPGGGDAGRTPPRRAPRDRRGLRLDPGAGRLQGARRAARARGLPGDGPQRHGGARGGGADHPAPHQRRPGADRQGLPALRRPTDHDQADERGREACHRHDPRRRGRPRRRRPAVGAAARPAHPPGRPRAVPHALALDGASRRAGRAVGEPRAGRPDPQHAAGSSSAWWSSTRPWTRRRWSRSVPGSRLR